MRGDLVLGAWPASGVTFETTRGSLVLDADVLARAEETGDDFEIRRAFARAFEMHPGARAYRREKIPGGGVRVYWRVVRVVEA